MDLLGAFGRKNTAVFPIQEHSIFCHLDTSSSTSFSKVLIAFSIAILQICLPKLTILSFADNENIAFSFQSHLFSYLGNLQPAGELRGMDPQRGPNCHCTYFCRRRQKLFPTLTGDDIFTFWGLVWFGFFNVICWCSGRYGRKQTFPLLLSQSVHPLLHNTSFPSPITCTSLLTRLPRLTQGFRGFTWPLITSILNYLFYPCHGVSFRSFSIILFFSTQLHFAPKPNYKHIEIRVYFIPCSLG